MKNKADLFEGKGKLISVGQGREKKNKINRENRCEKKLKLYRK